MTSARGAVASTARAIPRPIRRLAGRLAGWAATCALLWVAGGVRGLLLGVAVTVWDAIRPPTPRQLLAVATALLAFVPVAVLLSGLPSAQTISPLIAAREQAAHVLAGAGLALLVLGVLRDVRKDVGPAPRYARPPGRRSTARAPAWPTDDA